VEIFDVFLRYSVGFWALLFATFIAYPHPNSHFPLLLGWTNISGVEDERGGGSRHDLPAERAEALLRKMEISGLEIQPGAHTYNHILDCVSFLHIRNIVLPVAISSALSVFSIEPTLNRDASGRKVKPMDARVKQ
jgi:hypothetical protein